MRKAVILAGGAGTGIKILTCGRPKVLLKVLGKAVIEYVLDALLNLGIKRVTIVTDKPKEFESVTLKYGKLMEFEIRNQEGEGLVAAILTAADELARNALLVYGDTLMPTEGFQGVVNAFMAFSRPVIAVVPEEDVSLYGAVTLTTDGRVKSFIEKPEKYIEGAYAFGGVAILDKELVELIESEGSLDRAINSYVGRRDLMASIWSGWWVDVGYPWNVLEAQYYLLSEYVSNSVISRKAKIASTAIIEGPVVIEEGAQIDHYAVIKGPAYIGRNVLVGTHAFIRPYVGVEEDTTIGSYVELVWSTIEPEATIGRGSFLGFSVVGERAVIESNVITKLLVEPESEGIRAIKVVKKRKQYTKIGAFIGYGARVHAGKVLQPGEHVEGVCNGA